MATVAKEEWRYWHRSKLAISVLILMIILVVASVVVTGLAVQNALHEREHLQTTSEQTFLAQPGRHPHRMVHYGHYVFRAQPPLSAIDPGVDAYTGTSIFLEGHRQNTATFADQQQSGGLTRFSRLTPAYVLQVLVPLLLILLGYSVVSREREGGTLTFSIAQGIAPGKWLAGKFIALLLAGAVVLCPLLPAGLLALKQGEAPVVVAGFFMAHAVYILLWCGLVTLVSTLCGKNSTGFVLLIGLWILLCLLIPRIATSTASSMVSSPGKLESDFAVLRELRQLGDGHNAADPAFAKLKSNLLAHYKVNRIEDLPINFRGVVAQTSEAQLTEVLNRFAEERMREELDQARIARRFGWLSPAIALRTASMTLAGTHLETHHRFLREAEQVRFAFVQGLNKVHAQNLAYQTDINRYKNKAAADRARVDAENWQLLLNHFTFKPDTAYARLQHSALAFIQLFSWLLLLVYLIRLSLRALP